MRSVAAMNGSLGSGASGDESPAMTGSMKYGPNLYVPSVSRSPLSHFDGQGLPLLIQRTADQMSKCLWLDLPLFLHFVHVDSISEHFP
jgi:hypothetical protein